MDEQVDASFRADIQGKSGEANAQLVTTLGSGSGREHATMIAAERHRKKREVEDANSFTRRQKRFTPQGADVPTFDSPGLTADEQLNAISKGGVKEGGDPLAAAEPLIEQRERLYRTQREQKTDHPPPVFCPPAVLPWRALQNWGLFACTTRNTKQNHRPPSFSCLPAVQLVWRGNRGGSL